MSFTVEPVVIPALDELALPAAEPALPSWWGALQHRRWWLAGRLRGEPCPPIPERAAPPPAVVSPEDPGLTDPDELG